MFAKRNKGLMDYAPAVDRLSALPDEILEHIFSFLDSKDAFLSTRYTNLWKFVPVIDFNCDSIPDLVQLFHVVRVVLSARRDIKSPVNTFRFKCDAVKIFGKSDLSIQRCVRYVKVLVALVLTAYDVTHLDIWVTSLQTQSLEFLVGHRFAKLTSLNLRGCFINCQSAWPHVSSCFPSLNSLCLIQCFLFVETDQFDMLSDCPNLKSLVLRTCVLGPGLKILRISSPELLSLTVECLSDDRGLGESCMVGRALGKLNEFKVEISGPKVNFFRYSTRAAADIHAIDLPSIQQADLCLSSFSRMKKLFKGISNVQSLVLSSSVIQGLAKVPGLEHLSAPLSRLKLCKRKPEGRRRRKNFSSQELAKVSSYLGCQVSYYSWDVPC